LLALDFGLEGVERNEGGGRGSGNLHVSSLYEKMVERKDHTAKRAEPHKGGRRDTLRGKMIRL
jgi:hypothetical protein